MIPYIHRGNLVQVYWAMKNVTDNDFSLDGLDYRLYYSNGNGRSAATGVSHSGNVVQWSFQPTAEWAYGIYSLVLELYSSGTRLMSITYPNAFHLGKNDVIPAQASDDSQQGTQTALQEQEEVSIAIRTWGDFYRFQPVVPVVDGEHGYWVVDGVPVVDDDGHYVYAGPTADYDSESEYLIINADRYNEYTVTAFHEALEAIRTATAAARDLEATISGNETDRVGAEALRVEAETLRVAAERQRVSREAARIDAEALREYNESQRATAEEVRAAAAETAALAETARIVAENARALKEGQRNTAEGNRASAEQEREEAEAVRLLAEEDRAEEEVVRQEAEEARGTAESQRSAAASLDHQRAQADHETAVGDHEAIDSKADKSTVEALALVVAGKYTLPNGGIPKTDLAAGVIPDVSNFITNTVDDLLNYYLKSETYTKEEVQQIISTIQGFSYQVVSTLPTASADTMGIIYLVPSSDPQVQNVKDEYITIDNGQEAQVRYTWEQIGSTAIDLSGYVTTTDLSTALAAYTTTANLTTLLAAKQNVIDSSHKLSYDLLEMPLDGIPKADLAQAVQESLLKADASARVIGTYAATGSNFLKFVLTGAFNCLVVVDKSTEPQKILQLSSYANGDNLFAGYDITGASSYLATDSEGKAYIYSDGSDCALKNGSSASSFTVILLSGDVPTISIESSIFYDSTIEIKELQQKKLVASFQNIPDDEHYPSEKLVYDSIAELTQSEFNTIWNNAGN